MVAKRERAHMVEDKISDDIHHECDQCESLLVSEEITVLVDYNVSGLEQVKGGFSPCGNKGTYFLAESDVGVLNKEGREVGTGNAGLVAVERKSEDLVRNKFCNDVNDKCDSCECLPTSKENDILIYDNRSGLEQVEGSCPSPCGDKDVCFHGGNDDRVPHKGSMNAKECSTGFVAGEQDIIHKSVGKELSVRNMLRMENISFSHTVPEVIRGIQENCSLPCETDYGSADDNVELVENNKEENQSYSLDAADEEREHAVLEHKTCKVPNSIKKEEDSISSSDLENVHLISTDRRHKELVERACSSSSDCHAILSNSGNDFAMLSSEREIVEEDHGSSSVYVGEKGYLIFPGEPSSEASGIIHEQKHDECKSSSVLRTSSRDTEIHCRSHIELQSKHFSEVAEDKICATYDNLINSSDLKNIEVYLLSSNEDKGKQLQCPQDMSRQVQAYKSSCTKGIEVRDAQIFDGDTHHNSHLLNEIIDMGPRSGKEVVSVCALEGHSSQKSMCPTFVSPGLSDLSVITTTMQGSNSDSIHISSSHNNVVMDEGAGRTTDHKPVPLLVFRRTNPKRAASSRSSQTNGKYDQLTNTRNAVKTCTKKVNASKSILSINIKISGKISRKRSNRHRVTRHSVWGDAANLVSIFKQTDNLSESLQSKSGKLRKTYAKTKKQTIVDTCSRMLKIGCSVSANRLHPKDQKLQKPVSSDSVDTQLVLDSGSHAPLLKLDVHSDLGMHSEVHATISKLSEDRCACDVKMLQHGDKDLESILTQDTSNGNVPGEFHGVSSHVDMKTLVENVNKNHILDPGSSPDSDVYNPTIGVGVNSSETTTERIDDTEANPSTLVPDISNELHPTDVINSSEATTERIDDTDANPSTRVPDIANVLHPTDIKSSTLSLHVVSSLDLPPRHRTQKGDKKKKNRWVSQNKYNLSEHNFSKDNLHVSETPNKTTGKKIRACFGRSTKKVSNQKTFNAAPANKGLFELENHGEDRNMKCELANEIISEKDSGDIHAEESKGVKLSRSKKTRVSKGKSHSVNSSTYRRKGPHKQKKKNAIKSFKKQNENTPAIDVGEKKHKDMNLSSRTSNEALFARSSELQCHQQATMKVSCGVEEPSVQSQRAWVQCDECHKWRAISVKLADVINETNGRWICKDNSVTAFASCSIPQEMSNEEINAELGISDASCDEDTSVNQQNISASKPAVQPASWTPIRSNIYMHRNRRSQTIDEIMVCHCKPPTDGSMGCGDTCLNRMLSIECVKGTCPCGDLCSNQKFQKRKYAKLKRVSCGKKGFGLQLLENVSRGQFLIEYVGEVLDMATYESRQRYYALRDQKHFYFMTLNGGEVIDACAKGNLGRFINHSCSPNCQTEKWMVNGEVCIGLFAMRDIKKGEEMTFDYNYERVVGAVAKKCLCGSSACQGYIGGGENNDVVVQEDSDNEDPKPTVYEDNGNCLYPENAVPDASNSWTVEDKDALQKKFSITQYSSPNPLEHPQEPKDICGSELVNSLEALGSMELAESEEPIPISGDQVPESCPEFLDGTKSKGTKPIFKVKPLDLTASPASVKNSILDSTVKDSAVHQTFISRQHISKNGLAESSHSDELKIRRKSSKILVTKRDKKAPLQAGNNNLAGVEKELNKLLDFDGGISKQKDAARGYLKLLFLTAAEGDGSGGSSKSIRDLSLILDALLKTKSRTVLMDVINKNGLQMLHNIMKQNRNKFNRIPIIRKLLKVLEFLALKEILTPEHMNKGPPCSGVESFRESILALTRHNDVQVHQIARNFRDKWIPRNIRSFEPADRDNYQSDFSRSNSYWFQSLLFGCQLDQGTRGTDAIICVSPTANQSDMIMLDAHGDTSLFRNPSINSASPLIDNNSESRLRTGKRRSGWDQIPDISGHSASQAFVKDKLLHTSFKLRKTTTQFKTTDFDDEAPPGFEPPQKVLCDAAPEKLNLEDNVVVGYSQERYLSHLTISYGIPLTLVQQPGNIEVESNLKYQKWAVAPSLPFHPFPPLPPYPRVNSMSAVQNQESSDGIVANCQDHNQSKLQKS